MRDALRQTFKSDGTLELQTYAKAGGVKIGTPAFSALAYHGQTDTITEVWFVDSTHSSVKNLPKRIKQAEVTTELNGQFDVYKHDRKQDVLFTAPSGQYFVYVSKGKDAFVAFVKTA